VASKKKPGFMGFEGNVGGLNKVIAGSVDIAMCYNGDAIRAVGEHPNIGFCIPSEGTVVWMDSLCIPRSAPNPTLAMKFINFLLDAEMGAKLSNFNQYATPNKASLPMITPADLANPAIYPDAKTESRLEYVQELSGGSAIFGELWKIVKTR
ncbi:MAG TPA: extracellular solute-binding protein, partial [Opitutales bacterium]|nr:extracellular solute-binding protein [Opitutales bacterium]